MSSCLEVIQHLSTVFRSQGLDGFELHYDLIGNQQVRVELSNHLTPKLHLDRSLALDLQSLGPQGKKQGSLVYRLQEAHAQFVGDLESCLKDLAC